MAEIILSSIAPFFISGLQGFVDHQENHFPGNKLSPSRTTRGQGNNVLHVAVKYRKIADVERTLKEHPLLADEANAKGDTPLHIAARLGIFDVATCLVKHEKDLEAAAEYRKFLRMVNDKGNTALHEAVLSGHYKIADLLIKEDPISTSIDNKAGESPLFIAVDAGYKKIAVRILETFPLCSISAGNGITLLHAAVIRAHPRIIDLPGIPIDVANVITRVFNHHHDDFVGQLLKKCGSQILLMRDAFGWMPHHYAANKGLSTVLKRFLKANCSLANEKDKEGMSALHISAKNGNTRVIKTLIEEYPDVCDLLDKKGRTALHIAVEYKQAFAVYAFLNTVAFNDLLNEQDNEGNTALHLACIYGHFKIIIRLLYDSRTNKRTINKRGMTAYDIINRSSILGPFDKFMIKSQWRLENRNSLLEARAIKDTKERQKETSPANDQAKMSMPRQVDTSIAKENKDKSVEHTAGINLLVATIIASITFSAAMNMPGGYEDSNGMALLRKRTSFRYFLAFDSLAFGCSAASMIMHFAVRVQSKLRGEAYKYPIQLTALLTFLSITSTVLAFVMGTYSVLYENKSVPNSKSIFGLPGSISFAAFFITLLAFFIPLLIATFTYIVSALAFDRDRRDEFGTILIYLSLPIYPGLLLSRAVQYMLRAVQNMLPARQNNRFGIPFLV